MKSSRFLITLLIVCAAISGVLAYVNRQKALPPPVMQPAGQTAEQAPTEKIAAAEPDPTKIIPENTATPAPVSSAAVTNEGKSDDSESPIRKCVDALLSAKSGAEKHDLFQQLVKSGQIDAAIAELKQRMADNPNDPEIPTTLGEAQLNQVRAIKEAGGDPNDMGILALQADQSFNAALKIDPANYEAQLVKSISQTFWPVNPARDNQVVQTLSGLIDRQETMTPQPDFAQTYLYLGNEYQKIGQPDKALATWQLGLTKFPNNAALLGKLNGQ
jgi:tetratricopeptide (TPR) repeat protein